MDAKFRLSLEDRVSSKLDGIANKVGSLDNAFKAVTAANVLGKLGSMAMDFGGAVIESLRNYEKFSASLRVLLGGDKQAAEALNNQLVNLAKTTPFELKDVQEGSRQLLAYGFSAGGVTKNLKMLGDVSSAVGAPLTDIVYLYGTLKTQGRAYQKDINQFTGRGIPIIKELAKQFGVTESAVQDLVKDGKVGFKEIEKAFQSLTKEGGKFFGMMDEQAKTVDGKLSNMGDAWEQLKVSIGRSQTGIISSTAEMVTSMISEFTRANDASNELEMARKESGLGSRTWLQKASTAFLGRNSINSETALNAQVLEQFNKTSASNKEQDWLVLRAGLLRSVSQQIGESRRAFENKDTVGVDIAKSNLAVLYHYLDKVTGSLTLLRSGDKTVKDEKTPGGPDDKTGLPTEYRGEKPQAINININEVNGIRTATITDYQQTTPMAKEALSNALLEVIDDINKIVRNR